MADDHKLEAEWSRLNGLIGYAKDPGARNLIAAHMDKIARQIGFPLTLPEIKENQTNG